MGQGHQSALLALAALSCGAAALAGWHQQAVLAAAAVLLGGAASAAARLQAARALRAVQDDLRTVQQGKATFLRSLGQEISTPLNGMFGMTSLLLDTALDARQRRFAQVIQSSGESMMRIFNATVDYAQVEAGKLQLELYDFPLTDLLEDAVQDFAAAAAEKDLQMFVCMTPEVPHWVRGDPVRLQEVLKNVLSNAVKFSESGAVVLRVRADAHDHAQYTVHIAVEDSGVGMDARTRERLFEAFSQADLGTRHKATGAGLGLALAARLVRLMGGSMTVASEVGRGTRLGFCVELVQVEGAEPQPAPKPLPGGKRALVVEAHPVGRAMLSEQLRIWGLDVRAVPSGQAAVQALARDGFDVMLVPAAMPQLFSVQRGRAQVAPALVRIAEYNAPPALLDLQGDSAVLSKPLRPSRLRAFLANVLR